jgi:hypothetical protein
MANETFCFKRVLLQLLCPPVRYYDSCRSAHHICLHFLQFYINITTQWFKHFILGMVNFTDLNVYSVLETLKFSDNCAYRVVSLLNKKKLSLPTIHFFSIRKFNWKISPLPLVWVFINSNWVIKPTAGYIYCTLCGVYCLTLYLFHELRYICSLNQRL